MLNRLRKLVEKYTANSQVQYRYQIHKDMAIIGLLANLLLFIIKLVIGVLSASIAIMADAFNSLSDCASSIVALFSSVIGGKPADQEHPYGHGRIEYIATLVVSFIIIYVGLQVGFNAITKIIHPTIINITWLIYLIFAISILIKSYLYYLNHRIAKAIDSNLLFGIAQDSLNDIIANLILVFSMLLIQRFNWNIDGYLGLIISLIIMYNGYKLLKDSTSTLLGTRANVNLEEKIAQAIKKDKRILGFHHVQIHDYGPNRIHASVDIELPDTLSLIEAHKIVDYLEKEISDAYHIHLVLHIDPISSNSDLVNQIQQQIEHMTSAIDPQSRISNLKAIVGHFRTALLFDVTIYVAIDYFKQAISHALKQSDSNFAVEVTIWHQPSQHSEIVNITKEPV